MDVKELLESKSLNYMESGRDFLIRCINPDHEDKNPSLRVDKVTGVFNCLSCGFSGNVFSHYNEKVDVLGVKRERLKLLIDKKLRSSVGLNIPADAIYINNKWRNVSADTMRKFSAFSCNSIKELANRTVFPIRNMSGNIVAFCGRQEGATGFTKYMFYPAGQSLPLFPVVKPINGRIVLVEGIYDMLNLHDKGITNAVCAFGVNKVTSEKVNILKMQGVIGVDIMFDSDEAGQNSAKQLQKDLEETHELSTRIISLEGRKDPGDLTAEEVISIKENLYGSSCSN